jgi:uncharacterized membrane protein
VIGIVIVCLSLVGLLISTYFTAVSYHWIRPDERWIPRFCRLGEKTCATIVFTPRARVFGLPNSVLGQVYYLALIVAVPAGLLERGEVYTLFFAASSITVLLGIYLSYSLLFLTKVPCKLCFTSHGINLVLFLLLVAQG